MPLVTEQKGMEALTFVPIADHPHGGVFWCGSQLDGRVYIYDIDLTDGVYSPAVEVEDFAPVPDFTELSALNYQVETTLVWGLIDRRWLFALGSSDMELKGMWPVGVGNPEGISIIGSGPKFTAYLACDACQQIWKFEFTMENGFLTGKCANSPPVSQSSTNVTIY